MLFQNIEFSKIQTCETRKQVMARSLTLPLGACSSHWKQSACTPAAFSVLGVTVLNGEGISLRRRLAELCLWDEIWVQGPPSSLSVYDQRKEVDVYLDPVSHVSVLSIGVHIGSLAGDCQPWGEIWEQSGFNVSKWKYIFEWNPLSKSEGLWNLISVGLFLGSRLSVWV